MTEWLHFHFSVSCIGERNGNPLQYSCLENPRDRGACWAAIYGVAQSRTWLPWLSSRRILTPLHRSIFWMKVNTNNTKYYLQLKRLIYKDSGTHDWIWGFKNGKSQYTDFIAEINKSNYLKSFYYHLKSFHIFCTFSVQFSCSVMSQSLQPHEPQHARPSCPSPTPRVHPNPCPLSRWCHPTISSLSSPSPPALNVSQHQDLFKWVSSSYQVAKVLEFQLQH